MGSKQSRSSGNDNYYQRLAADAKRREDDAKRREEEAKRREDNMMKYHNDLLANERKALEAAHEREQALMNENMKLMGQQMRDMQKNNEDQLAMIIKMSQNDQKAALDALEKKSEQARQEQEKRFQILEKQRKEEAERKMSDLKNSLTAKHEADQAEMEAKMAALSKENHEERERLMAEQAARKEEFDAKMDGLQYQMELKDKEHEEKMNEMMKIVEKKNYESHYPIPEHLKNHIDKNQRSFNIQILGCRGAGKSTFVNKFMKKAGMNKVAETGTNETTKETAFYEITEKIENIPKRYDRVFICDQPGIGGLEITEAGYLNKFGPGHFNFTLMLGEKGFNEMDMSLLKHLLFNKKPLAFVRTQCDSAINGILDSAYDEGNEDMTFEEGLQLLQKTFRDYIKTQVISKVDMQDLEIFFIGLPPRKFPDFERMVQLLLSGEVMERIGAFEPLESLIPEFQDDLKKT